MASGVLGFLRLWWKRISLGSRGAGRSERDAGFLGCTPVASAVTRAAVQCLATEPGEVAASPADPVPAPAGGGPCSQRLGRFLLCQ